MSGTTIFIALCISGLPFLAYIFISFSRDSKRPCRTSYEITGVREHLVLVELPGEYACEMVNEDENEDFALVEAP